MSDHDEKKGLDEKSSITPEDILGDAQRRGATSPFDVSNLPPHLQADPEKVEKIRLMHEAVANLIRVVEETDAIAQITVSLEGCMRGMLKLRPNDATGPLNITRAQALDISNVANDLLGDINLVKGAAMMAQMLALRNGWIGPIGEEDNPDDSFEE